MTLRRASVFFADERTTAEDVERGEATLKSAPERDKVDKVQRVNSQPSVPGTDANKVLPHDGGPSRAGGRVVVGIEARLLPPRRAKQPHQPNLTCNSLFCFVAVAPWHYVSSMLE